MTVAVSSGAPVRAIAPRSRRVPPLGLTFGLAWLVAIFALSMLYPWIPSIRDPDTKVRVAGELQTSYRLGPGWTAWWGVDGNSFDVFARCIAYTRNSLVIGVTATAIGLVAGSILGVLAGYFRGWVDRLVSILVDCLLAVPALVLAIMLIRRVDTLKQDWTFLDPVTRKLQIILTLSVLATAPLARIVRAQTLSLRERDFVLAARTAGARHGRVIRTEILPNLVPTMVTVAFTGLGLLIAAEGALAFLGLGLQQSWGYMIEANRRRIEQAWWATFFPSMMMFLTVVSFNLIGDWLARRFDIRESAL